MGRPVDGHICETKRLTSNNCIYVMNRQKLYFVILLWLVPLTLFSQRYVSGRVTCAEDGEPISGISVFFNGTTVGIPTDSAGYYRLRIPGTGSYKLAVSHAGYQPFSTDIEPGLQSVVLNVAMDIRELEEVTVAKTVKFRKEDIELFWKTILGKKPAKNTIFTTNPETVYYYYNSETRILTVTCRVPLQIINLETGYQIEFILERFTHDYNTFTTHWDAKIKFTALEPVTIKQKYIWGKNRENVYQVSTTNFIRSLYNNSLKENGFLLINIDESYFNEPVSDEYATPLSIATKGISSGKGKHELPKISLPNLKKLSFN